MLPRWPPADRAPGRQPARFRRRTGERTQIGSDRRPEIVTPGKFSRPKLFRRRVLARDDRADELEELLLDELSVDALEGIGSSRRRHAAGVERRAIVVDPRRLVVVPRADGKRAALALGQRLDARGGNLDRDPGFNSLAVRIHGKLRLEDPHRVPALRQDRARRVKHRPHHTAPELDKARNERRVVVLRLARARKIDAPPLVEPVEHLPELDAQAVGFHEDVLCQGTSLGARRCGFCALGHLRAGLAGNAGFVD